MEFVSAFDWNTGEDLLGALARIIILLLALCVHEWAHAFAAVKCGDYTPKLAGRLTLNPLKHFDPIGFVMLLCVNVGYAKPVPINSYNFRHQKRDTVWVSLAGVISNFCMAFIFLMISTCIAQFAPGWYYASDNLFSYFIYSLLTFGYILNIALMVFNLLPIYPLDGFRLVEVSTRGNNRYRTFMYRYGQFVLLGLLIESVLMNMIYRSTGIAVFYYLDILGNLISQLSQWIIWPLQKLWMLFWGVF